MLFSPRQQSEVHLWRKWKKEKRQCLLLGRAEEMCWTRPPAGSTLHPAVFISVVFRWFMIICLEMIRLSYIYIKSEGKVSSCIIVLLYRSHRIPWKAHFRMLESVRQTSSWVTKYRIILGSGRTRHFFIPTVFSACIFLHYRVRQG